MTPECFALHFLISDAVVDQCLVPHRVQGVFKCLAAKLVGLRRGQSLSGKEQELGID